MPSLNVESLDFFDIKQNLIDYLSSQAEFQDYNFHGSAMNTLLDTLAYANHYMAMQANMSLNESFLDSATLRTSVISRAKELGYVPTQVTSAKSSFTLSLNLTADEITPSSFVVPKWTKFSSLNENGQAVEFLTTDDTTLFDTGEKVGAAKTKILENTVNVTQGILKSIEWTYSDNKRFIIKDNNVTVDNLEVTLKPSQGATSQTIWDYENNIINVNEKSTVFFVSEAYENRLEIYFGNNKIGKSPDVNNYIIVNYIVSKGIGGNNLSKFVTITDISGKSKDLFTITNAELSYDGAEKETIASIKKIAPLEYQRQNRVVTLQDYKSAILAKYNNVQAINVWGGETNDPPQYGKVFVSIKPLTGNTVSPNTKKSITENILKKYNVVGITPEIIDPGFIYINLYSTVNYIINKTTLNPTQLSNATNDVITNFFITNASNYDSTFKYSNLLTAIDGTHTSFTSNITEVELSTTFFPGTRGKQSYLQKYNNSLLPDTVFSSKWINKASGNSQLKDDGLGNLDLYVNDVLTFTKVGVVNYDKGEITFTAFDAENSNATETIFLYARPVSNNVKVIHNMLLTLGNINISMNGV